MALLKEEGIKYLFLLVLCLFSSFYSIAQDTVINIPEVKIVSSIKMNEEINKLPSISNTFNQKFLTIHNVKDFKDFSSLAPTLYIPDYGSKITSSIYIRGIGSRIDNSSVGICMDGVMLLSKNCFDFPYFDFANVDILKGSQAIIFGMNTMAGIISLTTLSPCDYQGLKASLGIANGNTYTASFSIYEKKNEHFAFMAGADAQSTQGFFKNNYNGKDNDWLRSLSSRVIFEYRKLSWKIKNSTYISAIHQGGYNYQMIDTSSWITQGINYNDKCGYDRFNIMNNTSALYKKENKYSFQSLSSIQLNFDKLNLDNDFTSLSYFTLNQKEKDYAFSQEFILKNECRNTRWDWIIGTFLFYKYLDMRAPLLFKKDGIDSLILANANNGLHTVFPYYNIEFLEDNMLVNDKFYYKRFGGASYAQVSYTISKWKLITGIRFDYENVGLDYLNSSMIHYRLQGLTENYKILNTTCNGNASKPFTEVLPKLSLLYNVNCGNIFASISKGYMTGGYNTQMFADIIRNSMMQNMFRSLGIRPVIGSTMEDIYAHYNKDEIINYKPEYLWDYELGTHLYFFKNKLVVNTSLFFMNISNQQLTVFLSPQTTGRMMTNAAKSRSLGGEISVMARIKDIILNMNYGYANAIFINYNDGKVNYKGKFLPYYPINTLSLLVDYSLLVDSKLIDCIDFAVKYTGNGKIYFNTQNTLWQKYTNLFDVDITLKRNIYSFSFWCRNIFNVKYNTFYFLSAGHNFVQKGCPLQIGILFRVNK